MKGLLDRSGQVFDPLDQIVVLGAWTCDPNNVDFLKSVVTDQVGGHLTADDDNGYGIHEGRGDTGDRVGGTGTRGHQTNTYSLPRAGVTIRSVNGALLVSDQDMANVGLGQLIVNIDNGSAGIYENAVNAFLLEYFP